MTIWVPGGFRIKGIDSSIRIRKIIFRLKNCFRNLRNLRNFRKEKETETKKSGF